MATRVVEGKKPYTGGKAISIDENKVISLNLRDENNLIIYDEGDNEIYVDLQLDDEITPTSAFPIGVNVGRVIVDNGWDKPGTIISAETTSGDNIKIFYADEGTLWIDNGTGTFKQIYFKSDVDTLLSTLRNYIDGELAKKQNGVSSDTAPSNPSEGDLWYDTTNSAMKVWDGTAWQSVGTGGGGSDIVYATQAEYNALLPGALTDNKHYFIYTSDSPTPWQPGANTIAYYPLTSTTTTSDESGNGYDLSDYGTTTTFVTKDGVSCAYMDGSTNLLYNSTLTDTFIGQTFTISYWITDTNQGAVTAIVDNPYNGWGLYYEPGIAGGRLRGEFLNNGIPARLMPNITATSGWHHVLMTHASDGSSVIYYDGVQKGTGTCSLGLGGGQFTIGGAVAYPAYTVSYFSNVIIENVARTAQEIADYYNQTKANYGIS